MPLEVQDIDAERDFPALMSAMIRSYETPLQGALYAFLNTSLGEDEAGRRAQVEEAAARFKLWHTHDPTSYWQKAVDTETGEVVGAANWKVHTDNPFASPAPLEVDWCPDDGSRRFTEQFLVQHATPRAIIGQRPQVYLFICFTTPEYRRRGVAQQLMSWGVKKADEMGVESFIDASEMARPLYENNGYTVVQENHIAPKADSKDDAWKEMEGKVGPAMMYVMWRPAGGPYEEGKTPMPWKQS